MSNLARYSLWLLALGFLFSLPFLGFLAFFLSGGRPANENVLGLAILSVFLALGAGGPSWIASHVTGILAARHEKHVLYWVLPHMILVLAGASTLVIWCNLGGSATIWDIVAYGLLAMFLSLGIMTGVLCYVFRINPIAFGEKRVDDLRGAKLIASAILIGAGGICLALGELQHGLSLAGLVLVSVGVPLMIIQWRRSKPNVPRVPEESDEPIETGFKANKDLEI